MAKDDFIWVETFGELFNRLDRNFSGTWTASGWKKIPNTVPVEEATWDQLAVWATEMRYGQGDTAREALLNLWKEIQK